MINFDALRQNANEKLTRRSLALVTVLALVCALGACAGAASSDNGVLAADRVVHGWLTGTPVIDENGNYVYSLSLNAENSTGLPQEVGVIINGDVDASHTIEPSTDYERSTFRSEPEIGKAYHSIKTINIFIPGMTCATIEDGNSDEAEEFLCR